MTGTTRRAAVAGLLSISLLVLYAAEWIQISTFHIGRSDFTSSYVGATLLAQGHRGDLYSEPLQAELHARLIAPDTEGNLPFVNPPTAAALLMPLTALPLPAAFRVWSLLQLACLVGALVIVNRAAPWPAAIPRLAQLAIASFVLALPGTAALLLLGQWNGIVALGLATAYALWRRELFASGLVLSASMALFKPHLGLGLAGFVIGYRNRRLIAGAAIGAAVSALLWFALIGPAGIRGLIAADAADASRWSLRSLLGLTGFFGSWLGDGSDVQVAAGVGSLVLVGASAWLGRQMRDRRRVEVGLFGATALSLCASPHLLGHDLATLEPAALCAFGAVAAQDAGSWPGGRSRALLLVWCLVAAAAFVDLGNTDPAPPGRVVPLALLAAGTFALRNTRQR